MKVTFVGAAVVLATRAGDGRAVASVVSLTPSRPDVALSPSCPSGVLDEAHLAAGMAPDMNVVVEHPPHTVECRGPRRSSGRIVAAPMPAWLAALRPIDLPIDDPASVERALRWMLQTERGRAFTLVGLRRSGRHVRELHKALADRQLPRALAAVPFAESSYSEAALSKVGASGLWQIMPATARGLGLVVTPSYDERRSPSRSTDAALRYLASLYLDSGSWPLALAAYDLGPGRLKRTMKRFGVFDFAALSTIDGALPAETRGYVPMILACALVLENVESFGFEGAEVDSPLAASDLDVPTGAPLAIVARAAGTSLSNLRALNPEILSGDVVPAGATLLHVPDSGMARARVMLGPLLTADDDLTRKTPPDFDWGMDDLPGDKFQIEIPGDGSVDAMRDEKTTLPPWRGQVD